MSSPVGGRKADEFVRFHPVSSEWSDTSETGAPPQRKYMCGHGNIYPFGLAGDFIVLALLPGRRPCMHEKCTLWQRIKDLFSLAFCHLLTPHTFNGKWPQLVSQGVMQKYTNTFKGCWGWGGFGVHMGQRQTKMYATLVRDTVYTLKTRHARTLGTKSCETACLDVG